MKNVSAVAAVILMAMFRSEPAHAETLMLKCVGKDGSSLFVTIDPESQVVDVLGDYGLHWRAANAQISDNRIYWETHFETQSRSGTDTWTLDRYSGTLRTFHPGTTPETSNASFYECEKGTRPPKKF
jgi:hypothetical protein